MRHSLAGKTTAAMGVALALVATIAAASPQGDAGRRAPQAKPEEPTPAEKLEWLRNHLAMNLPYQGRQASSLFFHILKEDSTRSIAEGLRLTSDQEREIARLDALIRDTIKNSWAAEIDYLNTLHGPTDALMRQVDRRHQQLRDRNKAAADGADRILLMGILNERQCEMLRRLRWKMMRETALYEPDLADRLKLSREQRRELVRRKANKAEVDARNQTAGLSVGKDSAGEDLVWREIRERRDAAVALIWDVLEPDQMTTLETMLRDLPPWWKPKANLP
ncbi:MAG TPA: hypothetical protein VGH33_12475 [Isosphaeraceae bacterium]